MSSRPRTFRGMRHHSRPSAGSADTSRPRTIRGIRHQWAAFRKPSAASRPRTIRGMRHPMARNRLLSLRISHCRHRKTELLALHPASTPSVFPHSERPPFILSARSPRHTTGSRSQFGNEPEPRVSFSAPCRDCAQWRAAPPGPPCPSRSGTEMPAYRTGRVRDGGCHAVRASAAHRSSPR